MNARARILQVDTKELGVLAVLVVATILLSFVTSRNRLPIASVETKFEDTTEHGLAVLPASCASSPSYYHSALATGLNGNTRGYISNNGEVEYGGTTGVAGVYVCITNASGSNLFVPVNTQAEIDAFKASAVSGVQKW